MSWADIGARSANSVKTHCLSQEYVRRSSGNDICRGRHQRVKKFGTTLNTLTAVNTYSPQTALEPQGYSLTSFP